MSTVSAMRLKVGLACVVLAMAPVTAAIAHEFTAHPTISIDYKKGFFFGQIHSQRDTCKAHRSVEVYKLVADGPNKLIGTTESNGAGEWGLRRPNANGRFVAKVPAKVEGKYGHVHRCMHARSDAVEI